MLVWAFLLTKVQCVAKMAHYTVIIIVLMTTSWAIVGAVFRFGHEGKVCAGDYADPDEDSAPYQWHSGMFIKVYMIGLMTLYSLVIYGFMCLCIGFATGRITSEDH